MNRTSTTTLASLALALVIAGCGNGSGGADMGPAVTCQNTKTYPAGPYGTAVGDIIQDLTLRAQTGVNGMPAEKKLSDYRNDCVAGKLKVLAIVGAAFWCGPCMMESDALVIDWNDYKAKNEPVAFLDVVVENNQHKPTNDMEVNEWATRFNIPFDVGSDPNNALAPYFDLATFPTQMVINLDDMSISARLTGYMPGKLTAAINEALSK